MSRRPTLSSDELWHIDRADREALRRDGVLLLLAVGAGFVIAIAWLTVLTRLG